MLLTYDEYTGLGYTSVPEAAFERYATMAAQTAKKHTLGRLRPAGLSDVNKRGLCELTELFYRDATSGIVGAVSGFSNGRYSESYAVPEAQAIDALAADIIGLYFTPEQLCRWL